MWFSSWLWNNRPTLHPLKETRECLGVCPTSLQVLSGLGQRCMTASLGGVLWGFLRCISCLVLAQLEQELGCHCQQLVRLIPGGCWTPPALFFGTNSKFQGQNLYVQPRDGACPV